MSNNVMMIIFGLITIVFGTALIYSVRKEEKKIEFDERQLQARAKGIRLGYDVLCCFVVFVILINATNLPLKDYTAIILIVGLFGSFVVYCLYAIKNEAFVGMNDNYEKRTNLLFVVACVNCGNYLVQKNQNFDVACLCACCGASLFIVASALRLHAKKSKTEED